MCFHLAITIDLIFKISLIYRSNFVLMMWYDINMICNWFF